MWEYPMRILGSWLLLLICTCTLTAQELVKYPPIARVLPPVGLKPDAEIAKKLRAEVEQLEADLKPYDPRDKQGNWNDPQFQYFADIAIFPKAVRWALDYDEFYKPADFATAEKQLKLGRERLDELKSGVKQPSWTTQRGLTVRGYISPIDNSVQPYGVHVPEHVDLSQKLPLYIWLHGRGEKVTDLHFIQERLTSKGKFAADDGITIHPFGRYCNAFKFMGERDVLDVMQQAEVRYQTDPRKRILIGFSMGGAGVWHIGSRYPHLFCAIAPGAGFSESREFLGITDDKLPPWYEQELWKWYDAPTYVQNLFTLPVIAYSGEKDKQKQAADVMEREFAKNGKKLNHIIGPGMGHEYDKESLAKIAAFLKEAHEKVSSIRTNGTLPIENQNHDFLKDAFKSTVYNDTGFTTKYNTYYPNSFNIIHSSSGSYRRLYPVLSIHSTIDPFKKTTIEFDYDELRNLVIIKKIENINCFRIGDIPNKITIRNNNKIKLEIDSQIFEFQNQGIPKITMLGTLGNYPDNSEIIMRKTNGKWTSLSELPIHIKQVGHSGPIDDAFMDHFIFVKPTGKALNPTLQAWYKTEMEYQIDRWRRCFRGDIQVINDTDWEKSKYYGNTLVLWGDENCNSVIRHLKTDVIAMNFTQHVQVYDSNKHVVSSIIGSYHTILNPPVEIIQINPEADVNNGKAISEGAIDFASKRLNSVNKLIILSDKPPLYKIPTYIVLNSGPTFRDEHDRNNANQTPKLPDWAIIDVTTPPDGKAPGKVVTAGFFDHEWKFVDPAKQEAEWRAKRRDGR
jgi:predicted esterase